MFTFFWLKDFFTGLWPLVWHFGVPGVAVIALLVFYFAAPAWFLPGLRNIALWLALAGALYIVGLTTGVKIEKVRNDARNTGRAANEAKVGSKARADAERSIPLVVPTPGGVRHKLDNYDRD